MGASAHSTGPESWIMNSTDVPKVRGDCFSLDVATWESTVYHGVSPKVRFKRRGGLGHSSLCLEMLVLSNTMGSG